MALGDIWFYQRKKPKGWRVVMTDGSELNFGAGKQAREDSQRSAIAQLNPDLVMLLKGSIDKFPDVEARAWRAALVVLDGTIEIPTEKRLDGIIAFVTSGPESSQREIYKMADGSITCGCEDYGAPTTPNFTKMCKHVLAMTYQFRLNQIEIQKEN